MENHLLLEPFKSRMRLFHNLDDENINRMLKSSQEALEQDLGLDLMELASGQELIMERSRYVYNDCLELFDDSFAKEKARLAMYGLEKEYESKKDKS